MNRGHLWIGFVIALLAGNTIAVCVLMAEAGDPSSRVLPDYYARGVAYDDVMAAAEASQKLGWEATASVRGEVVEVRLGDRQAAPVRGAEVTVTVDPRGRTDRTATATLTEAAPGLYRGTVDAGAPGLYVVATTAVRDADRFVASATIERGSP